MRNRLGENKWWNLPSRNPTINRYNRFLKKPGSKIRTLYSDSKKEFEDTLDKKIETMYSNLWELEL